MDTELENIFQSIDKYVINNLLNIFIQCVNRYTKSSEISFYCLLLTFRLVSLGVKVEDYLQSKWTD